MDEVPEEELKELAAPVAAVIDERREADDDVPEAEARVADGPSTALAIPAPQPSMFCCGPPADSPAATTAI